MPNLYSEDHLIEQTSIELFKKLWGESSFINAFSDEWEARLERNNTSQVVLTNRLRKAIEKLNPDFQNNAVDQAIDILIADRSSKSLLGANEEIYGMIKDGVKVQVQNEKGQFETKTLRIIDWNSPEENDFLLVSQMWISGDLYQRRPDLVGFVNGIPLLLVELKAPNKNLFDAYNDNLRDYKDTIPQIFWYNACIIISNGIDNKIGTLSSGFEHFAQWKKVASESETPKTNLETMINGVCDKTRFLDIVENFTIFDSSKGKTVKIIAKYHQYFWVNQAIENFKNRKQNKGKLGVFWHTQWSGKSFSIMFFASKILRKLTGNYTFVIVTDRDELDKQIYKGFVDGGIIHEKDTQATSIENLKELLSEDHRFVFTLIHKFQFKDLKEPINLRDDIIIITDEAHRTQYGELSMNMRLALPNANFIGFTWTPLIAEEKERTKEVFGDYVSVYNFSQSVEDGATVPIFYENRVPKLENSNENIQDDLSQIMDKYDLDEDAEEKLESEFSTAYHILTREDRLESIAEDIVGHFMGRGNNGKAMVVCIDKKTTVRMYYKVQKYLLAYKEQLQKKLDYSVLSVEKDAISKQLQALDSLDTAVIISLGNNQNEIDEFKKIGVDFKPIRKRLLEEDLETKYKDPNSNLRIAFVCNMWLTGFDVPNITTLYLDKPMKNHTLMQTIARTNRIFWDKTNGLVVDYIWLFSSLQKALATYATPQNSGQEEIIGNKDELINELKIKISETRTFLNAQNLELDDILETDQWSTLLSLMDAFVDVLISKEELKKTYLNLASKASSLYASILPDVRADGFKKTVKAIAFIAEAVRQTGIENIDLSEIKRDLEELLNRSIEAEKFVIKERFNYKDLSKLPIDTLREYFSKSKKRIAMENLKNAIEEKIAEMVRKNKTRLRFLERLNSLIQDYNAGSKNVDEIFNDLIELARLITEEEQRAVKEWLSEEELAIFDLLRKENLTPDEEKQVKLSASELLKKIQDKLVIDWRRYEDRRANVEVAVEDHLYYSLPRSYDGGLCKLKSHQVYMYLYENQAERNVGSPTLVS